MEYYTTNNSENLPLIFVIKGGVGSGKTAFVRHLFDELHEVDALQPYLQGNK